MAYKELDCHHAFVTWKSEQLLCWYCASYSFGNLTFSNWLLGRVSVLQKWFKITMLWHLLGCLFTHKLFSFFIMTILADALCPFLCLQGWCCSICNMGTPYFSIPCLFSSFSIFWEYATCFYLSMHYIAFAPLHENYKASEIGQEKETKDASTFIHVILCRHWSFFWMCTTRLCKLWNSWPLLWSHSFLRLGICNHTCNKFVHFDKCWLKWRVLNIQEESWDVLQWRLVH